MPIADSSAPIVVGIRHTNSATSTVTVIGVPWPGHADAEDRIGQERHADEQEDNRHAGQQDVQGDFVGRLLPLGAFDHGDHAIEKRFARVGHDAHDQPVGEHAGAAGDAAAVAAAFADHRALSPVIALSSTEATPSIDLAVGRNVVAGFDQHEVALSQIGRLGDDGLRRLATTR